MADGELDLRLRALARTQDGVVTRRDVLAAGGTPNHLRARLSTGAWTPLLRGSYLVDPWRDGAHLQRSWARAGVLTVRGAVVGMASAAALHGIEGAPRTGLVDVVTDREVQVGHRRLAVHRFALRPDDVLDLAGLPVTTVTRTLADLVPRLDRPAALGVLDSALRHGLVDATALADAAALAAGRPGHRASADLWALADGRAESALESRARLRCVDDDLAPDDLQVEVHDEHGHLLARADMTFHRGDGLPPLILEADGRGPHEPPEALYRDRWRSNTLVALGHRVVRCTWADTTSRLAVPTMVRQAL